MHTTRQFVLLGEVYVIREFKLHIIIWEKADVILKSREFLKIGNEQIRTAQNNSYG